MKSEKTADHSDTPLKDPVNLHLHLQPGQAPQPSHYTLARANAVRIGPRQLQAPAHVQIAPAQHSQIGPGNQIGPATPAPAPRRRAMPDITWLEAANLCSPRALPGRASPPPAPAASCRLPTTPPLHSTPCSPLQTSSGSTTTSCRHTSGSPAMRHRGPRSSAPLTALANRAAHDAPPPHVGAPPAPAVFDGQAWPPPPALAAAAAGGDPGDGL
nr:uncharacterized protein LOC127303946 [Lolium perenne]